MKKKSKKPRVVTVYTCGVDWQHEIGECTTHVFATISALKSKNPCWEECGITKLSVTLEKWTHPQDLFKFKGITAAESERIQRRRMAEDDRQIIHAAAAIRAKRRRKKVD